MTEAAGRDPPEAAVVLASARRDLARLPAILDALLADLEDALWRARPAPNEWSPLEIVCHLRDEEAEDFGARVRVLIDGGSAFAPIEPEGWAVERRYRDDDPRVALATLTERRLGNLNFLARIDAKRLGQAVDHPRAGRLSGLDLLTAWVTHDRLHLAQLAATLARVGADRWPSLRADYAGPLPYGTA